MIRLIEILQVTTGFLVFGFFGAMENGEPMLRQTLLILGGILFIAVLSYIKSLLPLGKVKSRQVKTIQGNYIHNR